MDASQAILYYEGDQNEVAITELTDQGDHRDFRSSDTLWSRKSGRVPVVTPNGVYDGGRIIPAVSGSNNVVDISQCRAYIAGVLTTISASTDLAIARPTVSDYCKYSIQITSGGAFSAVKGTEGSSFSATRGAAGGPPYVLATSCELGQVWYDAQSAAAVLATEIKQVQGSSLERYNYPLWEINHSNVVDGVLGNAGINFYSALPLIHTGDVPKDVYASWWTPEFVEVVDAYDWQPPPLTVTINSTQTYGAVRASSSQNRGAGSFSALLQDGVSDNILRHQNDTLWFKFYPHRLNAPYQLVQGKMVQTTSFPSGDSISAAFTVAAETGEGNVFA
jgi:hypothetical protein